MKDIINHYHHEFDLPKLWGKGKSAAADGTNDPEQQEKSIKYGDLVANAVIFQNIVDLTAVIRQLKREGYYIDPEDLSVISPYLMEHIKRFGDYVIDLEEPLQPLDGKLGLELKTA